MNNHLNAIFSEHYKCFIEESLRISLGHERISERKIKNSCKWITKKEVEDIISLLHVDYQNLNVIINIHGNKFTTRRKILSPFTTKSNRDTLREGLNGDISGFQRKNSITVFSYFYKQLAKRSSKV